jgi:hypothetical protein
MTTVNWNILANPQKVFDRSRFSRSYKPPRPFGEGDNVMPAKIGVVHASIYTTRMEESFIEGLQSTGSWPDGDFKMLPPDRFAREGRYGRDDHNHKLDVLEKEVADLATKGCALIVACGLVAVKASYNAGGPPTVGLIGRTPANITEDGWNAIMDIATNVKCVVDLNAPSHNLERRDQLRALFPVDIPNNNQVALMVNSNSTMGAYELAQWEAAGQPGLEYPDLIGKHDNDHMHFKKFFKQIPAAIRGIVISSDPFLTSYRTSLIAANDAAATELGRTPFKLCFPFAENQYKPNGVTPVNGWSPATHIAYPGTGSNLLPAYHDLGVCALNVLSTIFHGPAAITVLP